MDGERVDSERTTGEVEEVSEVREGDVEGSFLAHLTDVDRSLLLDRGVRRDFTANDTLLSEGDPSDHLHVIVSGWVRVSTLLEGGQEIIYALRGPGDVLGELAALNGWSRTASVRGIEPVSVVQLSSAQFLAALHDRPGIAIALLKTMSTRLREAEMARIGSATLDVSMRLAKYLADLAVDRGRRSVDGVVIDSPLTQEDIANHLGASRRAVARALGVLRSRGVVSTGRKRIVVHRPDVLRALTRL